MPKLSALSLLLLAFLFVTLLFGPKKLPEVTFALGRTFREFMRGMKG